jgi:hypothetical protein
MYNYRVMLKKMKKTGIKIKKRKEWLFLCLYCIIEVSFYTMVNVFFFKVCISAPNTRKKREKTVALG